MNPCTIQPQEKGCNHWSLLSLPTKYQWVNSISPTENLNYASNLIMTSRKIQNSEGKSKGHTHVYLFLPLHRVEISSFHLYARLISFWITQHVKVDATWRGSPVISKEDEISVSWHHIITGHTNRNLFNTQSSFIWQNCFCFLSGDFNKKCQIQQWPTQYPFFFLTNKTPNFFGATMCPTLKLLILRQHI